MYHRNCFPPKLAELSSTHAHTHTYIYIYIHTHTHTQWCLSHTQQNFTMFNNIKFFLCLTDTSLYIYICVKHFGMANIKLSSTFLKNKRPTWCHLLFYFTSCVLKMFRTLIYPTSGACDYSIELPHWSYCSWFDVCWSFGVVGLEWYPWKRKPATRIPLQPKHTETPTHIEPRTIQPMW